MATTQTIKVGGIYAFTMSTSTLSQFERGMPHFSSKLLPDKAIRRKHKNET